MKEDKNKIFSVSNFPRTRLRRNRMTPFSRRLVKENSLSINDLIYPIFVTYGSNVKEEIKSMPGIYRFSLDLLANEIERISSLDIPAIALFPKIEQSLKDPNGSEALNKNNLVCNAIKISKKVNNELGVICDVALDPFTDHGHDGVIINDQIDNDKTLEILCDQALIQAEAGCDIIAPSDMMDGRIGLIRDKLDSHDFTNVQIMSYAVKYASAFYGPFRDAVGSTVNFSNKSKESYQMDPANSDEALREVSLDINEGADMFIVKPGMPYLDIIYKIKQEFKIPLYAYQVSGEYSMIKAAIDNGWFDEQKIIFESLIAFKRAGCSGIITYFAPYVAKLLKGHY
jgi:porphobilinogen synthase